MNIPSRPRVKSFKLRVILSIACIALLSGGVLLYQNTQIQSKTVAQADAFFSQDISRDKGSVLGIISQSEPIFKIAVPTQISELLTLAQLVVTGESVFEGPVTFNENLEVEGEFVTGTMLSDLATLTRLIVSTGSIFEGVTEFRDVSLFNQGIQVAGSITATTITADTVTAGNLLYDIEVGDGLSVTGNQNITLSNTDRGSAQNIYKKVSVGGITAQADANDATLSFASGDGISLSLNQASDTVTITNATLPGLIKSGTYAVLASGVDRLGVGTDTPGNTVEINSGVAGQAGLTFSNLNSASAVGSGGGKVLSVDSGGNVILVTDESGGVQSGDLDSALPGGSVGSTIYFDGTSWGHTTNLYHNGGQIGISTTPAANVRLDVKTNSANAVGLVVRRVASQTANIFELRSESDSVLAYFDENGVFNGSVAGGLNPNLTTGSVVFQGANGLAQDNSNFFWDDTNNRLGIGRATPASQLEVYSTSAGKPLFGVDGNNVTIARYLFSNSSYLNIGATWNVGGSLGFYTDRAVFSNLNVGIGISNPTAKLHVYTNDNSATPQLFLEQDGTGDASLTVDAGGDSYTLGVDNTDGSFNIWDGANTATTNRVTLTSAGNVGIGTTSPSAILEVQPSGTSGSLLVQSSGVANQVTLSSQNFIRFGVPVVPIGNYSLGSVANYWGNFYTNWARVSGSLLVGANYQSPVSLPTNGAIIEGNVGIGTSTPGKKLDIVASGGSAFRITRDTSALMYLEIQTGDWGSGYGSQIVTPSLRITNGTDTFAAFRNNGYIGIGTTNPGQKLDVSDGSIALDTSGTGSYFVGANANQAYYPHRSGGGILSSTGSFTINIDSDNGDADTRALYINKNNSNISGTNLLTVLESGNVGIGTSTPEYLLDVAGSVRISDLTFSLTTSYIKNYVSNGSLNLRGGTTSYDSQLSLRGRVHPSGPGLSLIGGTAVTDISVGTVAITGTNAYSTAVTNLDGGNVLINGGAAATGGSHGDVILANLRGNVGIGTTTPTQKLEVAGRIFINNTALDARTTAIQFFDGDTGGVANYGIGMAATGSLGVIEYRSGTANSAVYGHRFMVNGINVMEIEGTGNIGLGTTDPANRLDVRGALAVGSYAGLNFAPSNGMIVSGNVGIGTTSPNLAKLEVNGNVYLQAAGARTPRTLYINGGDGGNLLAAGITGGNDSGGANAYVKLGTYLNNGFFEQSYIALSKSGNVGIGTTTFGTDAAKVLALAGSTAPTTAITDGIQLFAVDVAGSHELQVMDEAGNTTTLSPHNFSVIGDRSEDMAWSFYSERNALAINADMTKAMRIIERISGEKIIYLKDLQSGQYLEDSDDATKITELAQNGLISSVAKWNYDLWTFMGEVVFQKPATFLAGMTVRGKAVFSSDAWFGGRVTYADKDVAGFVIIPAGATQAEVVFAKPYKQLPIITTTPQGSWVESFVSAQSETGFTVELTQPQSSDVRIAWQAIAVEDATVTTGNSNQAPSASPSISPLASPQPTSSPEATPQSSPLTESIDEPSVESPEESSSSADLITETDASTSAEASSSSEITE